MILVVFDMHTYKEKLSPRTVAIVHKCHKCHLNIPATHLRLRDSHKGLGQKYISCTRLDKRHPKLPLFQIHW